MKAMMLFLITSMLSTFSSSLLMPTVMMGAGNSRRTGMRMKKKLQRDDKSTLSKGKLVSLGGEVGDPVVQEDEDYYVTVIGRNLARVTFQSGTQASIDVNTTELHQQRDMKLWLATRASLDVTASEFSAVLDKSRFSSRRQLLENKLGLNPKPFTGNAATKWGLRVEPLAVQQYIEVTGNTVYETGLWCHRGDAFLEATQESENCVGTAEQQEESNGVNGLGASPDGLVFDPKLDAQGEPAHGLLEVKCFFGRRHKKELAQWEHCPNRFYDQIQGQLELCDRPFCDLFLWIPRNSKKKNFCVIRVPRNRDYWKDTLGPAISSFRTELSTARLHPEQLPLVEPEELASPVG
mmetsp:Transcript_77829/g.152311  ORF Transcript_77829/g.152311 Transcript_77829/m.152311 type:complete len:350 (-) Transcript_77829:268-1317(-)